MNVLENGRLIREGKKGRNAEPEACWNENFSINQWIISSLCSLLLGLIKQEQHCLVLGLRHKEIVYASCLCDFAWFSFYISFFGSLHESFVFWERFVKWQPQPGLASSRFEPDFGLA